MSHQNHGLGRWPLGVFVSIDDGLGASLEVAAELQIPTVHLHAPRPERRTEAALAAVSRQLSDLGLTATCVFAGFPGESYASIPIVAQTVGLAPPATRRARTDQLLEIANAAEVLGVRRVGVHLGFIPHDSQAPGYADLVAVTRTICRSLAAREQSLHLETGQEPAEVLIRFLHDVECDNLFVNFDPANMILYGAGEPLPALRQLGPWVRSVHCKDATWSPEPTVSWGVETPLGEGSVNIPQFLNTLLDIGYEGPLTIEREIPHEPERQRREIGEAASLLAETKHSLGIA